MASIGSGTHICAGEQSHENSISQDYKGTKVGQNSYCNFFGKSAQLGMSFCFTDKLNCSYQHVSTTEKWLGKDSVFTPCQQSNKCSWDAHNVNQVSRQHKVSSEQFSSGHIWM